jgi:hypothetical protein
MDIAHDPVIDQRPDGRWEVTCPTCLELKASGVEVPVGIGLAVRSWEVALRLWENHIRPVPEPPGHHAPRRPTSSQLPILQ